MKIPLSAFLTRLFVTTSLFYIPVLAFAQDFDYAIGLFDGVYSVFVGVLPILVALAFLIFVWGLVVFISHSGDDKAREEGKNKLVWGVVALFVITAIWGILALLETISGASSATSPLDPPAVPSV